MSSITTGGCLLTHVKLEEIISAARNPINRRLLQAKVITLRRMAKDSLVCCEDAHTEFVQWAHMIRELRETVLGKQGEIRSSPPIRASPAIVPGPKSVVKSLPFPVSDWSYDSNVPPLTHQYWQFAMDLETSLRRYYKCLSSGPGGGFNWALLDSAVGVQDITVLCSKLQAIDTLMTNNMTYGYLEQIKVHFAGSASVSLPLIGCSLTHQEPPVYAHSQPSV